MNTTSPLPLLQWIEPLNDLARLRILRTLEANELGVGELAAVLQLPQSTVSRHLKRLLEAGWIVRRSVGTSALYRLASATLDDSARTLWSLAESAISEIPACLEDEQRVQEVISRRHVDSRRFFGDLGGEWTDLRETLFGQSLNMRPLLAFLDSDWTVADLGCGTGQMAGELANWVRRVEAVDREEAMLEAARKRLLGVDNIGFHRADACQLPFDDDYFDATILSLILHHLEDPSMALREASRITAGPIMVLDMMSHDRKDYRDTMGHLHLGFSNDDLEAIAKTSGLHVQKYVPLPPDPASSGPPVFVARLIVG
ncbi:MAG: ArsR family transcriptional regulator [Phycisphaerae bacterium]|nr:ArsR family transcriptional regulator [Phycisphaerae bacterium]